MHFFFVDDSKQGKPQRDRMGPMVGVGGLVVESSRIRELEATVDELCQRYRFPEGEVFKWSPGQEHWMRDNLIKDERRSFQIDVLQTLHKCECKAIFIAEDTNCKMAVGSPSHDIDVVRLLIERFDWFCKNICSYGIIISDRPPGDHKSEECFLLECLETLKDGTKYVNPEHIIMSVLTSPFKLSRLLQAADLITSCTMAFLCGEDRYSPPIAKHIKPLFHQEGGRKGGVGVKVHPDYTYANLYHWLFGDDVLWRGSSGDVLPFRGRPYYNSPDKF